MKVRIEIHLSTTEAKIISRLAMQQGRSRKNFCEREMRKVIQLSSYFTLAFNHSPVIDITNKPLELEENRKIDLPASE